MPPTERYINIITDGHAHFGVDPVYIDKLKSMEVQKRKDPSEYESLPTPEDLPQMTMADVEAANDSPLYSTCNGKVLKHMIADKNSTLYRTLVGNKEKRIHSAEVMLNTFNYEPLFGILKS